LVKWKLFNRFKGKEEKPTEVKTTSDHMEKPEEKTNHVAPETEATPVKEYNETLFSINSSIKQGRKTDEGTKEPLKRTSWESPRTIEKNIDTMKKITPVLSGTSSQKNIDIDKKVDQILLKKKMKS
jgi:hypothetical protein